MSIRNTEFSQEAQNRTTLHRLLLSRGILENWHDKTFADYQNTAQLEKLIKFLNENKGRGICLLGGTGTGKTMLMNLVFKEMILKNGTDCFIISFTDLVTLYAAKWKGSEEFDEVVSHRYLGIDDLDKGFQVTENSKELSKATLDYVLRKRVQRNFPTWVTTNLAMSEIQSFFGEYINSLFKEAFDFLHFSDNDFRGTMYKKI